MPTILLQEIRDLLTAFFTAIGSKIELIAEKLGLLDSIDENIGDIKEDTDAIMSYVESIDVKSTNLYDIKDNTGAIVTPIANMKTAVDTINSNTATVKDKITDISGYMNTISSNTGAIAGFSDDTATNTLNIYNKVVTIASDTTQLRADMQVIIALLQSIDGKV